MAHHSSAPPHESLVERFKAEVGATEAQARFWLEAENSNYDRAVDNFLSHISEGHEHRVEPGRSANTAEQSDVQLLMSLTGATDERHAQFCLEACHGNLDRAVNMYLSDVNPPPHPHDSAATLHSDSPIPNRPAAYGQNNNLNNRINNNVGYLSGILNQTGSLLGGLISLPIAVVRTSMVLVQTAVQYGAGTASLLIPQQWRQQLRDDYECSHADEDSRRQARRFISRFESLYGTSHPDFAEEGWKDAAARAHREFKFLWVYIHAPEHEDTDRFCTEVLGDEGVITVLTENLVCWGGDVRQSEAFKLSTSLGATTYPFCCLLGFSGSRTRLVSSMQGYLNAGELVRALHQAIDEQGAILVAERADRERMDNDRRLRQEQDMAYERSLANDKRLEEEKQRLLVQQEEERRSKLEEERRKRQEAEFENRKMEETLAAVADRKQKKRKNLKPEPGAGKRTAQIRVRMLDGSSYLRRFKYHDRVQDVFDYVDSIESLQSLNYSLLRMFPSKSFGDDARDQTLEDAGLVPDTLLLVKSNDD